MIVPNRSINQLFHILVLACWWVPSAESQQSFPILPGSSPHVIHLTSRDTLLQLPAEFLIPGSETVLLDSIQRLSNGADYSLDYRFGKLRLRREYLARIFADSLSHTLLVTFRSLPLAFKPEYFLNRTVLRTDTATRAQTRIVAPVEKQFFDDVFGSGLQKSGSIARGFTIGSNRDLSLTSGFRMQMAGNLSRDVDIVAALTDENTPIQPEGTTQTLREVDNVFVQLKSPGYGATLGDFTFNVKEHEGGEFGRLSRKLQGATGSLNLLGGATTVQATAGTQRGKYNSNQFQGIEGNQGPYQLTGKNGERRIVVVAGSERVYINGEPMTRGETNDYTIDYASGELVFMSKRLITNASRITVDYEYTDQQFSRNFLGSGFTSSLADGRVNLSAVFLQEADDPESPLSGSLDDNTRAILSNSGSDRFKASLPGARFVGRDSVTNAPRGQYVLRDTVIAGKTYRVFVYAPGDPQAVYAVTFSIVGQMPADSAGYVRDGIGNFRFAGVGQGNYLPVQFLPLPQLQRMVDFNSTARLGANLTLTGEYALSHLDQNRLSSLDDQNQPGSALHLGFRFNPREVKLGNATVGDIDLLLSERYVERSFVALDRYNDIEFSRNWNLESAGTANEEIREATFSLKPSTNVNVSAAYGLLNREGTYRSTRLQTNVMAQDSAHNGFQFEREDIKSSDLVFGEQSDWTKQKGSATYNVWRFQPGVRVEAEERTRFSGNDSLRGGSFRFFEIAPRLASPSVSGFQTAAEFQFRTEDSVATGLLQRASQSFTQVYTADYRPSSVFFSGLSLNIRKTMFTDLFKSRGSTDASVVLVRSQTSFAPLERAMEGNVLYEFSNQRAARLERIFLRVPKGTGNYLYKGDLNGNGIADDSEFELTRFDGDYIVLYLPSDQLFPVLDLRTSFRLRLEPARLIHEPTTTVERILSTLSTETVFRVEEKSTETDTKQIYLLNLSHFQNDKTISGSRSFTQDLFLFEHRADFSTRARYSERRSLVQLVSATEVSYGLERSLRVRLQLVPEIGNQTDFTNKIDRVNASTTTPRLRDLSVNSLSSDFSYRPEQAWEVGFRFEVSRSTDRFRLPNPVADMNEESVRTSYALLGAGQLRGELRREEAVLSQGAVDPQRPFPFEFTNGKVIGRTMMWQLAFDYRISQHTQVTLQYNGRKEADRATVHLGQVEAKIFF